MLPDVKEQQNRKCKDQFIAHEVCNLNKNNKLTIGSVHGVSFVNTILNLWQMTPQVLKFSSNVIKRNIDVRNVWNVADWRATTNAEQLHFSQQFLS